MGCDYYIITELEIVFKTLPKKIIEIDRQRGYNDYEFNSDYEDNEDSPYKIKSEDKVKLLFLNNSKDSKSNGMWFIKNKNSIDDYIYMLDQEHINLNDVHQITKITRYQDR